MTNQPNNRKAKAMRRNKQLAMWAIVDAALIGIVILLLCASCATLPDSLDLPNTSIAVTTNNVLVCVITNVPCLTTTNNSAFFPHMTDGQWALATKLLTSGTNTAWRLESRALRLTLKGKREE